MDQAVRNFHAIFSKYLPKATDSQKIDFLEIGCYPGRFLYYFAREFGYRVSGLDFLPEAARLPAMLAANGVKSQVYVADFLTFQPEKRYDVVLSLGVVEHFIQWQEILERHIALLKPGGTLVIEFPNFRYGQYWLRRLIDPGFDAGHVLEVMDPGLWLRALTERGFEIQYGDYFQTFQIWIGPPGFAGLTTLRKALFACAYLVHKVVSWLKIDFPNRYFSPYVLIIAKSPTDENSSSYVEAKTAEIWE